MRKPAAADVRQGRRSTSGDLSWSVIRHRPELDLVHDEWAALHRASGTPNPFSHPAWVTVWLDHFTRPEDLYAVAGRSEAGELVALAPFHRRAPSLRSPFPGRCLRLAGMGSSELLTEIPEILVAGHPPRKAMRSMMRFLLDDRSEDWDWTELMLSPRLGWLESDWVGPEADAKGARFMLDTTLAFVVLELPDSWEAARAGMKRNVKEAVRRSTNRLAKLDDGWEYSVARNEAELLEAIDDLVTLHHARSGVTNHEMHGDYLWDPRDEAFLRSATRAMFSAGAGTVARIRLGEDVAAARLLLWANGSLFFSLSGMAPGDLVWDLGLGTQITAQALKDAIAGGITTANLSANPDEGKLRWSEQLELHHGFLVTSPRRGAWARTSAYRLYRELRSVRDG
jgi:CelD/BcsL family acetyltransferase involved in cellulose biosynthesis